MVFLHAGTHLKQARAHSFSYTHAHARKRARSVNDEHHMSEGQRRDYETKVLG